MSQEFNKRFKSHYLIHLRRIEFPTPVNWTSQGFKGCWVAFFIFIQILIEHSESKQWIP